MALAASAVRLMFGKGEEAVLQSKERRVLATTKCSKNGDDNDWRREVRLQKIGDYGRGG